MSYTRKMFIFGQFLEIWQQQFTDIIGQICSNAIASTANYSQTLYCYCSNFPSTYEGYCRQEITSSRPGTALVGLLSLWSVCIMELMVYSLCVPPRCAVCAVDKNQFIPMQCFMLLRNTVYIFGRCIYYNWIRLINHLDHQSMLVS